MSLQIAQEKYDLASHLLTITFPLVKDPKLFIPICQNILEGLIILDPENNLLVELSTINKLYLKSPMAFRRKEMFIICDEKFEVEPLTEHRVKTFLHKFKEILTIYNRKD